MMIIDGLDKCGKTTLQEGLIRAYDFLIPYRLHRANVDDNSFDDFASDYWKAFAFIQRIEMITVVKTSEMGLMKNVVIDRFHGTEWSYLEDGEEKDLDYIWEIDEQMADSEFPSMYIFLDAPEYWIEDRMDDKELELFNRARLDRYYDRFHEFYEKTKMKKIRIPIRELSVQGVVEETIKFLDKEYFIPRFFRNK